MSTKSDLRFESGFPD